MTRTGRRALGAVVLTVALIGLDAGASAAEPDDVVPDPPPGVGLSRAVMDVPLTSPRLDAARTALERARTSRERATERLAVVVPEIESLRVELAARAAVIDRRDAQIQKVDAAFERSATAVREIAVEWFVTGFGALEGLDPTLTAQDRERLGHRLVISESAANAALSDRRVLEARAAALRAERSQLAEVLAERSQRSSQLRAERDELTLTIDRAQREIPELELAVEEAALEAEVEDLGLAAIVLDAYWRAERVLSVLDPSCGMRWWMLAGVGRVESGHGTYRGASPGPDGVVSPPIYGPDLDGSNQFAVIPDSDGGALDGTAATDRAVGPMQFIPTTWRMVGTDGDGDGEADPHNYFDAALTAGVYLCRSGPAVDRPDRARVALFTYNRDLSYVERVLELGSRYRGSLTLGG